MLAGEEVWCQLFSEPAAGSDLAGIQTRAQRARTTARGACRARRCGRPTPSTPSYGLLLARTDPDVPKHRGLTMFVLPMDAEGVSVRPLRQISGDAHFNEVFIDDVHLEAGQRGRPGRRRLGRRDDHADVRAGRDRPRRRGLRLARRPLRDHADRGRGGHARPRGPPPLRRDRGRVPGAALHELPDADHAPARRRPGPGGRAGEGHHRARGDRRRRADRRRARPGLARGRAGRAAGVRHARHQVRGRHRGDPALDGRRAGARAPARAAAGQGRAVRGAAGARARRRRA